MQKSDRIPALAASSLFFVAAFVFFGFFFSGHLHSQEEYQLFLFNASYFTDLASAPGGISAYLSRFLTQFFVSGVAGGFICALAISGVQLLSAKVTRADSLLEYACSFIPASVLWMSMYQHYSIINPAVSAIIALACALAVSRIGRSGLRAVVAVLLAPAVYWICGSAALIYASALFCLAGALPSAVAALSVLVSPLVSRLLCRYNLYDLYFGYFNYKDPEIFPWFVWAFFVVLIVLPLLSPLLANLKRPGQLPVFCAVVLFSYAVVGSGMVFCCDFAMEEELQYSHLMRMQKWDEIIAKADRKSPRDRMSLSCVNLALAKKGKLGDRMFNYIQCGVDGLIPPYEKIHTDNLFASDVYYHIGMVNASQRRMFESKEAIPDMQKGSRAYQRLAQTKSINRQWAASQKYLDALSQTLFYRNWALEFSNESEEMKTMRSWRYHNSDFALLYENMISQLGVLCEENPDNWMARQYLVCWALLERDLKWLPKFFDMIGTDNLPVHYQEAFLILFGERTGSLEGVPDFIDDKYVKRFTKFLQLVQQKKPTEYLFRRFGDSYWFYYYFNITK